MVRFPLLVLCLSACLALPAMAADAVDISLDQGELDGALYTILRPFNWHNGPVLVVAHGWRPPQAPLVADLDPGDPFVAGLLADGWLVATSSYRRNGLIIDDAREDLFTLLTYIVREHGPSNRIVIEGASLGANIAVLLAEDEARDWSNIRRMFSVHGVIALGADFEAEGPDGPLGWTWRPGVPLLLVSNRSEMASPRDYAFKANTAPVKPSLWRLERDGHVNINGAERRRALQAMDQWLDTGRRPPGAPPYGQDMTVDRSGRLSVSVPTERGRLGTVVAVDPAYGNVDTDFVVADLDSLGIDRRFRVRCGETTRRVFFGESYGDVEAGRFVAFINADGGLRLAVNQGHAARKLGCRAGDTLELLPPGRKTQPRPD